MLKKDTYATMVSEAKARTHELIYTQSQLDKKEKEIEGLKEEIENLHLQLEEEKEKYKKYATHMRTKKNESAKKWLNGYPDE